jgi:methionine-S-sulfoxide reductase
MKEAYFAAGCFWGVEKAFASVPGVTGTEVGYTGGTDSAPTYESVCTGKTGHAETVKVIFDPALVSYEQLVRRFFALHDPTQKDRQGPDVGTQYRSAIFYCDDAQKSTALEVIGELSISGEYDRPISTELVPFTEWHRAEEYHQRYFEKNSGRNVC